MYFDHILLYSSSIVSPFQLHVLFFEKKNLSHWRTESS